MSMLLCFVYLYVIYFAQKYILQYTTVSSRTEGWIKIINDCEVASPVVASDALDFLKAFVEFPDSQDKFIGTPYPYLIMQFKNMDKYTGFEVEVRDKSNQTRTFRSTNRQSNIRLLDNLCSLPLKLQDGWNLIVLDLQALCKRVFRTQYKHCLNVRIFANCRIRRIYFSKDLYQENELPQEYKVFGMRNPLLLQAQEAQIQQE